MPLPRKKRKRPQRAQESLLKSGVGFLLLSAAVLLPASSASAQASQQDFLRQQAEGLKAQMVRAQREQAADSKFAAEAYEAQQAYLMDTAEKSFRIGRPHTTNSRLVSGQPDSYQATPAMPPVHVAPGAYSIPPRRITPPQRAAYTNPYAHQGHSPQPRTIADLPSPAELGGQGESISGPANRVGLQDRLTGLLSKPKYHSTSKLPVPAFDSATQAQHVSAPTPAKRRSTVQAPAADQPLFLPDPRSLETAELQTPSVYQDSPNANRIDEAAYDRMAAAIAEREVDRAVAFEGDRPERDIAQVAMTSPTPQNIGFAAPRQQQSSVPTFYEPTQLPARSFTSPAETKQISVLSRSSQEPDGDNEVIDRLRLQREEDLPRPSAGSSSRFESLRNPEPSPIDEEKDQLEQRLRELERETERRDTQRRQRELEREENRPRPRRDDIEGEVRPNADETDRDTRPLRDSCDDFRRNLLGSTIRDISLDMSPRASRIRDQYIAISRSWTDRLGNVIATGAMVDLRRGYVIIEGNGGRQKIPYSKLSDADSAAVSEYWQIPALCSTGDTRLPQRHWVPQSFTWTASSLCHKPLYFENQQLERYGHTHGPVLQPFQSAAHFFVSLATLPYQSAIHPPTECQYALGYYRPGNCAPWLKDPIPISLEGLKRQAVVTTGLSFIP